MRINDFPVNLRLYPSQTDHHIVLRIAVSANTTSEDVHALKQIILQFTNACSLGLLSGEANAPESSEGNYIQHKVDGNDLVFALDLGCVDLGSIRVLIGMLRGDITLSNIIKSFSAASIDEISNIEPLSINNERLLLLPGLYKNIAYDFIKHDSTRARTDRLVRVSFFNQASPSQLDELLQIQKAWVDICEGGFSGDNREAVEFGILCDPGYFITPHIFEIGIRIFDNEEICFDILANGLHRYCVTKHPIRNMQVW